MSSEIEAIFLKTSIAGADSLGKSDAGKRMFDGDATTELSAAFNAGLPGAQFSLQGLVFVDVKTASAALGRRRTSAA